MSERKKIVYWNNIPAPYMVDRFNALARLNVIDLEVWFDHKFKKYRDWNVDESEWEFDFKYIQGVRSLIISTLFSSIGVCKKPDLFISLYSKPSYCIVWLLHKMTNVKVGLRVLKTYDTWNRRSRLKEIVKTLLFRYSNIIETVGEDGKRYASSYSKSIENIYTLTHTIDNVYRGVGPYYDESQKEHLKERVGLKGVVFLYVGRIWRKKGLDDLIDAYQMIQDENKANESSLLIVGRGVDEDYFEKQIVKRGIKNIKMLGYQQPMQLKETYRISDVFVFPSLGDPYGLVIDEALSCGLPVIATESIGEIHSRVKHGVNGFIIRPGAPPLLAEHMKKFLNSRRLIDEMKDQGRCIGEEKTPEKWAMQFVEMLKREKIL